MSTVLLMTDNWQPTVLRLVPFSNNNAKESPRKYSGGSRRRGTSSKVRNFPVLAVTRSGPDKRDTNKGRSASAQTNTSGSAVDNSSEVSCDTPPLESARSAHSYTTAGDDIDGLSTLTTRRHRKYAKKKVPEMRSEMKEAIKFSVADLNDQTSSSSSLHSGEFPNESSTTKDKHSKVDNTRTRLPKPSSIQQQDLKLYTPLNGVRRSVPLTPGELELQKFRDAYNHEQSLKRKKYKLNVNQLPRSTTPINDHDPDKLNMKQVIAFLQTKASKDLQKKVIGGNRGGNSPGRTSRSQTFYRPLPSPTKRGSLPAGATGGGGHGYLGAEDKLDNTRLDNSGCVSVLSTKSTPNMSFGVQSFKSNTHSSSRSMKSYKGDSSRSSMVKEKRPVKEFKLYRFLAVAPEAGRNPQGLLTTAVDVEGRTDVNNENHNCLSPHSPKRVVLRKQRDSTTANLIHRRASTKKVGPNNMPRSKESAELPKSIRLPSMNDDDAGYDEDTDDESCSTTSATCNSTKNSIVRDERSKLPKKGKCITFSDERLEIDSESHTIVEGDLNNNTTSMNSVLSGYLNMAKQPYKYSEVNKVGVSFEQPRQIHINMPKETNKTYSQEIVRLTLRNDKNSTRVTSYMSDLQSKARLSSGAWPDANWEESGDHATVKDGPEWFESPRELINSITNNNFVRVRQKTKASSEDR